MTCLSLEEPDKWCAGSILSSMYGTESLSADDQTAAGRGDLACADRGFDRY